MNCELHIAEVVGENIINVNGSNWMDGRLRCKILPSMRAVPDAACPLFPSFFSNQTIHASIGDRVWVLCNKDFSVGFVLGPASLAGYWDDQNVFDYSNSSPISAPSIELLTAVRTTIGTSIGAGETCKLDRLKIEYWTKNCLHAINLRNGEKIICYVSNNSLANPSDESLAKENSLYFLGKKECIMQSKSSKMTIKDEAVSINSNRISLGSENISLGNAALYPVLVSSGKGTPQQSETTKA